MTCNFTVIQEEGEALELSIIREGGALAARSVEYYITPNGEEEFFGATNVLEFSPGVVEHQITVLALGDGIPEVRGYCNFVFMEKINATVYFELEGMCKSPGLVTCYYVVFF